MTTTATLPSVVLFDLDETLVDSEQSGHRVAFNQAFDHLGLDLNWDPVTYASLLAIAGGERRVAHSLRAAGHPAAQAAEFARRAHHVKTRALLELIERGGISARPGAATFVTDLLAAGVRVGIVTTGSSGWVRPLLCRIFPGVPFELMVTGGDVRELKPHPEAYQRAVRMLDLPACQVVAVEDSPNGLAAAHGAGLACAVVRSELSVNVVGAELDVDNFGPHGLNLHSLSAVAAHCRSSHCTAHAC